MIWFGNSDLVNAVVAIERARTDMGRGFFWYGLGNGFLVVSDPGLTDTGYENLAWYVKRRMDPKLWDVEVAVDEAVPQLGHRGRMFLRITPREAEK